jgi:hypothetical protein
MRDAMVMAGVEKEVAETETFKNRMQRLLKGNQEIELLSDDDAKVNRAVYIFRNVARPAFLIVGSLAGVTSHSLLAEATSEGPFMIGVALSGAAFGMVWTLMVLIVGEVFGTANVGANYLFHDGFSSAMGTLLLSKYVAQTVYESKIDHSDETSDGLTCYGQDCFRLSHWIVAGLSLTCVLSSVGVLLATRQFYANKANTYEPVNTSDEGRYDSNIPRVKQTGKKPLQILTVFERARGTTNKPRYSTGLLPRDQVVTRTSGQTTLPLLYVHHSIHH